MGLLPKEFIVRAAKPEDHGRIIDVLPNRWNGSDLTLMLPQIFLLHFHSTSLIVESKNQLIAFLIGFDSQSYPNESYIHFVGINPAHRKKGIGKYLYSHFFDRCIEIGKEIVRACTSPINSDSIEFHKKMGFNIIKGDSMINNIPVFLDYNHRGDNKVLFFKDLKKGTKSWK